MHLLLVHQAFATPSDPGGTRHYELSRAVTGRGHRFTVVTSRLALLTGAATAAAQGRSRTVDGIEIVHAYTPTTGRGGFFGQLVALVMFAVAAMGRSISVRGVDVIMGTSPSIFQAATAWFVAAIRRKPFLLEIRDLWPEFIVDMGKLRNPVAIAMARALERFLYWRADHLLVNSPAYVDYLVSKGVRRDRISLIPNGVDPAMFEGVTAADAAAERSLLGANNKFLVMYAGALGPANDIETILAAAEILRRRKDICIALVGDGKLRQALESDARARKLDNVVFGGSRPKARIGAALAAADACLATLQNIAMFRTTYPNKVFDYLAAGRPIILAIDGVIRDVVERAEAGVFVPPGDAKQLAAAIEQMAASADRGKEMGRRGKVFVARHFNRNEHANAFADLIERLAKTA